MAKLTEKPTVKIPEKKFDDIVFYKKKYANAISTCDVKVTVTKTKKTLKRFNFIFNKSIIKAFGDYNKLFVGLYEKKLYFKPTKTADGWSLGKRGNNYGISITFTEDTKNLDRFARREYSLKYDDDVELYYIEIPEGEPEY